MCMYVCVACIVLQQHFPAALSSCYCTGFPAAAFYHLSSSLTNQITTSNADGHNIILVLLYKIPVPGIISTYKVRIVFNRIYDTSVVLTYLYRWMKKILK